MSVPPQPPAKPPASKQPPWRGRADALKTIETDAREAPATLVALALNDEDGAFLEQYFVELLRSDVRTDLKQATIIAIGHMARRFRKITRHDTLKMLMQVLSDEQLGPIATNTLDDIQMFAQTQQNEPAAPEVPATDTATKTPPAQTAPAAAKPPAHAPDHAKPASPAPPPKKDKH